MSLRSCVKVAAKKPRSWAITLIKNMGVLLGYVEAPDEKAAELAHCNGSRWTNGSASGC
jgi:hypothetical protein